MPGPPPSSFGAGERRPVGRLAVLVETFPPLSSDVSVPSRVQACVDNALGVVLENVNELEKRGAPEPVVGDSGAEGKPSRAIVCPVHSGSGVGAGGGEP
eukprot:15459748-Alexandrium_andersonii.AAC.1